MNGSTGSSDFAAAIARSTATWAADVIPLGPRTGIGSTG
jgi:hypothetical protein